jgi:deoxyribodipyrimidine photo-lyase
MSDSAIMWFRRDLRLADNPALLAAASDCRVVPLFVVDDDLWRTAGAPRLAYLASSLAALRDACDGALLIRRGAPQTVVPRVAAEFGARRVYAAEDFAPYGRRRDATVVRALTADGRELSFIGSPYAVSPGRIRKDDGTPYRVYTPFFRAWRSHGWRAPALSGDDIRWLHADDVGTLPDAAFPPDMSAVTAGETSGIRRWRTFADGPLADYADDRNRPDIPGTSALSVALRWGEIHPRTLLANLAPHHGTGPDTFRKEIAWREFYADVLFHAPDSARHYLKSDMATMRYDSGPEAERHFEAWVAGRTGYPFVDAGMRQLRAEGWMHNRLRMVTASFLVKHLHLPWQRGARHFMRWLRDGDLASNQHGWQWVAGTGTDAAPYFRIFNPISQGLKFDPSGDYVRRYIPELAELPGATAHEPWEWVNGHSRGYPARIVDHATERAEALRRYAAVREQ